jgi:hypothetical protein
MKGPFALKFANQKIKPKNAKNMFDLFKILNRTLFSLLAQCAWAWA